VAGRTGLQRPPEPNDREDLTSVVPERILDVREHGLARAAARERLNDVVLDTFFSLFDRIRDIERRFSHVKVAPNVYSIVSHQRNVGVVGKWKIDNLVETVIRLAIRRRVAIRARGIGDLYCHVRIGLPEIYQKSALPRIVLRKVTI